MVISATDQHARARAFQELHEGPAAFVIPNPWDLGTARLLAAIGFKALATTSSGMAFALGRQDGAIPRDAVMAHVAGIAAATALPVSADLENGFGDAPEAAAATVRDAAAAGLVGCSIEDASGNPASPIYEHGLAVERIAAAVEAARSLPFPFTLTARAESFLHGRPDLDDTIRRLRAFEQAGAGVLYAPGLGDLDSIRRVCEAVTQPVNVLATPSFTVAELEAAGARRISLGGTLCRAAVRAFLDAARMIHDEGRFAFAAGLPPMSELARSLPARPTATAWTRSDAGV